MVCKVANFLTDSDLTADGRADECLTKWSRDVAGSAKDWQKVIGNYMDDGRVTVCSGYYHDAFAAALYTGVNEFRLKREKYDFMVPDVTIIIDHDPMPIGGKSVSLTDHYLKLKKVLPIERIHMFQREKDDARLADIIYERTVIPWLDELNDIK
jgi:hypothetical protein